MKYIESEQLKIYIYIYIYLKEACRNHDLNHEIGISL